MNLAVLVLLTSCRATHAASAPPVSPPAHDRPPLKALLDELDQRHFAVQSVVARLNVTLRDNAKQKEHALIGVYLGDKDGNQRLRIVTSGNQVLLDLGVHSGAVEIWIPRRNRYLRGKLQDLIDHPQCQLSLLAYAGHARDLFFPRAWTAHAVERGVKRIDGRDVVSVFEQFGGGNSAALRLTLAKEEPVIQNVEVFDQTGSRVGTLSYAGYFFPGQDEIEARRTDIPYPRRIMLRSAEGVYSLILEVDEISLNSAIPKEKFEVPPPENTTILDLSSTLNRKTNLWE